MIFHDIIQNTDEWFTLRTGKPTTSKFSVFMAHYGKSFGEPAVRYAFKLAKEQVTGEREEDEGYNNKHMDNGHLWEPIAAEEYERKTFYPLENGGFCEHEKYNAGGSPDRRIPEFSGAIEIKCVTDYVQRTTIKRNSFDPAYKWQLLGNMWLCNLQWIDFVSYGYSYTHSKKLFIHRLNREDFEEEISMIEPRLEGFLELIEKEKKYL